MSTTYIIRRGAVRGAGAYITGEANPTATSNYVAHAWRFASRKTANEYANDYLTGWWRVVRLLPAGTMRARRKAALRELRAQAARLRAEHVGTTFAAWAFAAEQLEARAAELEGM